MKFLLYLICALVFFLYCNMFSFEGWVWLTTSKGDLKDSLFLLYRQSHYTYWYNDLYSMSTEAYVLQKV